MDLISYALSKKIATSAVSGVQSMSVSGQTLTINTKDSGVLTITFPVPKDGVSITDVDVENNQIICTMSDGTIINAGEIKIDSSSLDLDNYYTKKESDELYISKTDLATSDDIEKLF